MPDARKIRVILFGAAVFILVAVGLLLARCSWPEPIQMIPAPDNYSAIPNSSIATSSAQVVATQSVRVTIRREASEKSRPSPDPKSSGLKPPIHAAHGNGVSEGGEGLDEEITIEVSQAIAAGATSSAQASTSIEPVSNPYQLPGHGRLGIIAAYPVGVAADVQVLRVDVPPWLAGVPLEVSADLEANHLQAGVGVALGGKAFAIGGLWSRWELSDRGWFAGAGLRF